MTRLLVSGEVSPSMYLSSHAQTTSYKSLSHTVNVRQPPAQWSRCFFFLHVLGSPRSKSFGSSLNKEHSAEHPALRGPSINASTSAGLWSQTDLGFNSSTQLSRETLHWSSHPCKHQHTPSLIVSGVNNTYLRQLLKRI